MEPDFLSIFNLAPSPYLVVSPDFIIVAVNDAYLEATGTQRDQILDRELFDVFPDNPDDPEADGTENLRASLLRVLKNRVRDVMPIQRYDIPDKKRPGGSFLERYWEPINTPIFDAQGNVAHVLHRVENVTSSVKAAVEMRSELSAQAEEIRGLHQFAELFQQSPTFMAMLTGPLHRVDFVNTAYLELIGNRDVVGKPVAQALPDAAAQGYVDLLDEVYGNGEPFAANGARYSVQALPGGRIEERYVDFVLQPIRNKDGSVRGVFVQGVDVTERVLTEHRRDALGRVTDVLRDLSSPDDILYQASIILGETLGVSRVGYGIIDTQAGTLHIERDWNAPGVSTLAGTINLRNYGSFIDDLKLGKFIAINDVDSDPRTADAAAALKERSAGAFVNVPIIEHGQLVAVIFVNNAQARKWLPEDLELVKEIAERARMSSERLRTETAMRSSEAKFRTIADAMPQMVWSTQPDGYHDYYNQQWYDFTGMPVGSTDGKQWSGMFHPEDQDYAWERWHQSLATGEIYEIQYRLRHRSGEYRWVLGRALPIRNDTGNITRWMGTCTDIHAQKLSEDELKRANTRKDEFLAMLAHELRNPLAPISTAAQLLKMKGVDEKRVLQASEIIGRQVKHMTDLVDDLLDVSRVTRGLVELQKEHLDLKAVVSDALEQARPLLEARKHELLLRITSEQTCVHGDRTRLIQAITNLLNNAAKYTPQRGEIDLAIEVDATRAMLSVTDNGIGMTPALIPYVFDLFTQAERTPDRAQGGLGLGLALVKSIATLHGGSVMAKSEGSGKGSTFTFVLPLAKPEKVQVAEVRNETLSTPSTPLRIMVVDDNHDAAFSLAVLLEASGHQVTVHEDAEGALNARGTHAIQAFILDIGLPDIDGYALARLLRKRPEMAGKTFIALTGYGQAHDRVLSKAAGFDYHFVKPVDYAQLSEVLARCSTA